MCVSPRVKHAQAVPEVTMCKTVLDKTPTCFFNPETYSLMLLYTTFVQENHIILIHYIPLVIMKMNYKLGKQ